MGLMKKIFGDYSSRELKSIYPIVDKIESMADEYKAMSDEALRAKTTEFKERLQNGETLDDILPEACAVRRFPGPVTFLAILDVIALTSASFLISGLRPVGFRTGACARFRTAWTCSSVGFAEPYTRLLRSSNSFDMVIPFRFQAPAK